jgi:hypothetical protein
MVFGTSATRAFSSTTDILRPPEMVRRALRRVAPFLDRCPITWRASRVTARRFAVAPTHNAKAPRRFRYGTSSSRRKSADTSRPAGERRRKTGRSRLPPARRLNSSDDRAGSPSRTGRAHRCEPVVCIRCRRFRSEFPWRRAPSCFEGDPQRRPPVFQPVEHHREHHRVRHGGDVHGALGPLSRQPIPLSPSGWRTIIG